jgi:rSAM/selenodomain-associated transferase 1
MRFPNARILIFAKAPRPGVCKTRLSPALGRDGAAKVAETLLRGTVERVAGARLAPAELWCTPDLGHPVFDELAARFGLGLEVQHGDDLGARMQHAATSALSHAEPVLLIGTDCPDLDADYLQQAMTALSTHVAVLGPAEDGGYVLLGLSRAAMDHLPRLFGEMPWGSERVAELTRERLETYGLDWSELSMLADIDRPEDLVRLGV